MDLFCVIQLSLQFPANSSRAQKLRTKTITQNLTNTNAPKKHYSNELADKTQEVEVLRKRIQELQAQLAEANSTKRDDPIVQDEDVQVNEEKKITVNNSVIKDDLVHHCINEETMKIHDQINDDSLIAQAETWKYKIDKIYDEVRTALENYYSMFSKEKLLKLRTEYKQSAEQNRQMTNINGESIQRVCELNI